MYEPPRAVTRIFTFTYTQPVAGFGASDVETLGSATIILVAGILLSLLSVFCVTAPSHVCGPALRILCTNK
jgi:hypothetical protein